MSAPGSRQARGAASEVARRAAAKASYATGLTALAPRIAEIDRQIAELKAERARLVDVDFEAMLEGVA